MVSSTLVEIVGVLGCPGIMFAELQWFFSTRKEVLVERRWHVVVRRDAVADDLKPRLAEKGEISQQVQEFGNGIGTQKEPVLMGMYG
ncbi:hypothetical protein MTO96_040791 [Rhipicephalus appendiculatus]